MTPRRILWAVVRFGIGAALLAWVLSRGETLEAVGGLFRTPWLLPLGALLVLGGAGLEAVRLELLFRSQHMRLAWRDSFRVIAIGTFFNFCIPGGTGGDVMKLYYLASGNPGKRVEVLALLFVDRVVALVSVIAVILALAAASTELLAAHETLALLVQAALGLALLSVVFAVLALSDRVRASRFYRSTLDRLPGGAYVHRGLDAIWTFKHHGRAFVAAFAVSVLGHLLLLVLVGLTGQVVVPDAPLLPVCLLTLLGLLANVLPVTPGGLGVGEAATDRLFALAGYGPGAPILVAWRLAQIPLLVIGAAFYGLGTKKGAELATAMDAPADRTGEG